MNRRFPIISCCSRMVLVTNVSNSPCMILDEIPYAPESRKIV